MISRTHHNALIYAWARVRRSQGRCPYCPTGRLDRHEDTGRIYSRCCACRDRMATAHRLRKDRERHP